MPPTHAAANLPSVSLLLKGSVVPTIPQPLLHHNVRHHDVHRVRPTDTVTATQVDMETYRTSVAYDAGGASA